MLLCKGEINEVLKKKKWAFKNYIYLANINESL